MDDERSCDGSAFQMVGAATWKLRRPSCVLVEGTSMSWRSAERRFASSGYCLVLTPKPRPLKEGVDARHVTLRETPPGTYSKI